MKKTLILLLISFSPLLSQWVDRGDYKELNQNFLLNQIIVPKGEKYFYIADQSKALLKFDYLGNNLSKFQSRKLDYDLKFCRFSDDAKSYSIFSDNFKVLNPSDVYFYSFKVYSTIDDSLIFSKNWFMSDTGYMYDIKSDQNVFLDYSSTLKKAFIYCQYGRSFRSGGNGHNLNNGNTGYYYINKDSVQYIDTKGIFPLIYRDHYSKLLFKGYINNYQYYYDIVPPYKIYSENGSAYTTFTHYNDSSKKLIVVGNANYSYQTKTSNAAGYIPDYSRFANTSNNFISIINSTVSTFSTENDSITRIRIANLPVSIKDIILSPNDKTYIVSTKSHSICFIDVNSNKIINEIFFQDSLDGNSIVNTQNGRGFLVTNEAGSVKYFEPEFFTDSLRAFFYCDKQIEIVNKPIVFYSYSTGNLKNYEWNFGDGNTSNLPNPTHNYKNSGLYSVRLIVSDGIITDTLVKYNYITIQPYLKSDFIVDGNIGFPPVNLNFIDKSVGNIKSWFWDFGDSSFSDQKNPLHTYLSSGIYPVKLIVFDGFLYDTTTKLDFITIPQSQITDTLFEKENVLWSFDKDMSGISGFQVNNKENGFIVESVSGDKNIILRMKSNFDTIWTRIFYRKQFNVPLQCTEKNQFIFTGDTNSIPSVITIQNMDEYGNFQKCFSFATSPDIRCFDFLSDTNGVLAFLPGMGYNMNYLNLFSYDYLGKLKFNKVVYLFNSSDYVFSVKTDVPNLHKKATLFNSCLHDTYGNPYYEKRLVFIDSLDNVNYHGSKITNMKSQSLITDFKQINNNCFVYIEDMNKLYFYNYDTLMNWSDKFSNVNIKSLLSVNDSTFVVAGSKDGFCWLVFMDIKGKIISEHHLTNRRGSFNHVSLNKDKSLFIIGSLYKNSFIGKASEKLNEKILENGNKNALYLITTKSIIQTKTDTSTMPQEALPIILPNPAIDYIEIKNITGEFKIYNVYGELIYYNNFYPSLEPVVKISLKGFSKGVYFVKVGEKVGKFVKI